MIFSEVNWHCITFKDSWGGQWSLSLKRTDFFTCCESDWCVWISACCCFSVILFSCKLMRGFVCLCRWFTEMVKCVSLLCRWCNSMSVTERNLILIYDLKMMLSWQVSLIPVVHTSDAKPKRFWIFMNVDVDIGHHAACIVPVCSRCQWPPHIKETPEYHEAAKVPSTKYNSELIIDLSNCMCC